MSGRVGPFMNEDGDWWVPVDALPYLSARRLVKDHMQDTRSYALLYRGKMEVRLDTEHDYPCPDVDDPDDPERDGWPPNCVFTAVSWHFEEVERRP